MNLLCKIFGHKSDTIYWFDYKRHPTARCDRCDAYFRLSNKKLAGDVYETLMNARVTESEERIIESIKNNNY